MSFATARLQKTLNLIPQLTRRNFNWKKFIFGTPWLIGNKLWCTELKELCYEIYQNLNSEELPPNWVKHKNNLSKHEKKRKHITHTKGGTDGQMWMTLKQITSVGFENLLLFWAAFICIFYFEKFSTWIWCLPFAVYMKFKTESTRKLSNFDFQWTKILYQNNLKNIAFFFTFFKG